MPYGIVGLYVCTAHCITQRVLCACVRACVRVFVYVFMYVFVYVCTACMYVQHIALACMYVQHIAYALGTGNPGMLTKL